MEKQKAAQAAQPNNKTNITIPSGGGAVTKTVKVGDAVPKPEDKPKADDKTKPK